MKHFPNDLAREVTSEFRNEIATSGYIAVLWHVSDVQAVRPDLSDAEAWKVLKRCEADYDQLIGLDLDMIETHAEALFPRKRPPSFRPYQPSGSRNVFTVRVNDRFDVSTLCTGTGIFVAVYPITNDVPWIDPIETLTVDEADVEQAEREMAIDDMQQELPLGKST